MGRDEPRNIDVQSQYNSPLLLVIVFILVLLFLVLRDLNACQAHPLLVLPPLAVELVQQDQQIVLLLLDVPLLLVAALELLRKRCNLCAQRLRLLDMKNNQAFMFMWRKPRGK